MPETVSPPPSVALIPRPAELRAKLATAMKEVAFLRRLIKVAESVPTTATTQATSPTCATQASR